MKITVTKHARRVLALIAKEHELQLERHMKGFIERDQIEQCLIERLVAIGKKDPGVQAFLTYVGPIDPKDDEEDRPWSKDPREGRRHVVDHRKPRGTLSPSKDFEDDRAWPEPGERIA